MSGSQTRTGNNVGSGIDEARRSRRSSNASKGSSSSSSDGTPYNANSGVAGSRAGSGADSSSHVLPTQQAQLQQQPPQLHSVTQIVTVGNTTATALGVSASSMTTMNIAADLSPRESGDDSEDESEILEESPCGRWLKRREEVDQRDVPGIDCVHLAMDTEEGVEVVWNEVRYASLQELKSQEEKMSLVFDNLLQLDHHNIVKFHRYWTDTQNPERPRLIFITEFMSSGSLKQFLKRTKRNAKRLPLEAWRRWCTQILSALSYLHSCTPPILHGNLTCDSIFIQHNGLVKIGTVVPDAVHYSLRQKQHKTLEHGAHFMAPEYSADERLTAAVDIYAFGMCALEMAALEIQNSSGDSSSSINEETILRTINSLEHDLQRDLIFKCLRRNPSERPTASDLLFHPLFFEVHSLKLLAAHCLIFAPKNQTMFSETVIDAMMQRFNRPDIIMAHVCYINRNGTNVSETDNISSSVQPQQQHQEHQQDHQQHQQPQQQLLTEDASQQQQSTLAATQPKPQPQPQPQPQSQPQPKTNIREYRLSDVPSADKLEKFVEDVKFGVYPLTAFSGKKPPPFRSRASSPERADSVKSVSPEPGDIESRRIVNMMCSVKKLKENSSDILMTILLRMDDKMNRQLSCAVTEADNASDLTQELVRLGFVHIEDQDNIQALLEETLRCTFSEGGAAFGEFGAQERTFSATISEQNNGTIGSNNNSGNNIINNNTLVTTRTTTTITGLQPQCERSWSVADSQIHNEPISATITSPVSATAAAAVALGLTDTVTVPMVTTDPLAGTVMYVPYEQPQQSLQQHHTPTHQPLHSTSAQATTPPQPVQPTQLIQPNNPIISMNVTNNQYSQHSSHPNTASFTLPTTTSSTTTSATTAPAITTTTSTTTPTSILNDQLNVHAPNFNTTTINTTNTTSTITPHSKSTTTLN